MIRLYSLVLFLFSLVASPWSSHAQIAAIDPSFVIAGSGINGSVNSFAIQSNGKVVIGGAFTSYNGTTVNRIARLNADGSLDATFNIGTGFNSNVYDMAVQSDDKIIVVGQFTTFNAVSQNYILRLNADGSLDPTFSIGTGLESYGQAVVVQPDGKIIVTGNFTNYNGSLRNRVVRINSDGSIDNTFSIGTGLNNVGYSLALQSDGKVLVGGSFSTVNGTSAGRIARLSSAGAYDSSFNPGTGANSSVYSIAVQSDGMVVFGGGFTTFNGASHGYIVRVTSTGTIDSGFNAGTGFSNTVNALALQSDGKIVVVGSFTTFNASESRPRIARLESDGTIDYTFNPGTGLNSTGEHVAVMTDGRILAGGSLFQYNGTSASRIVRILSHSIQATSILPTGAFCAGESGQVSFTLTGSYNAGNIFTAQLSNSSGSFASPVSIGTLTSTTAGTIPFTIPGGTTSGTAYRIRVISSDPQVTGTDLGATSNITINAAPSPSVAISASPNGTICEGVFVTFTATPTAGGTSPTYAWTVNGGPVGTNSNQYTSSTLQNGDQVVCSMISNAACASGSAVSSNTVTMSVDPSDTPVVTISSNVGTDICAGASVIFTALATDAGSSPTYQWKLNGGSVGTNQTTYTTTTLADGDQVKCVVLSNAPCSNPTSDTSNVLVMDVTALATPSITISAAPSGSICADTEVIFTAVPVNEGSSGAYQWEVNGDPVGNNSTVFTSSTLADGDEVICVLTSNVNCPINAADPTAESNSLIMDVLVTPSPGLTISASPPGSICDGDNVTFTASPVDGGDIPVFAWTVDGIPVGTDSPIYSSSTLSDGQIVACTMVSDEPCASTDPVASNDIAMTVFTNDAPAITISSDLGNSICEGALVTFTAVADNVGNTPSYQWQLNGGNVGADDATYTNSALVEGDEVTCTVTSSSQCSNPTDATSDPITFTVIPSVVPSLTISHSGSSTICSGAEITFTAFPVNGGDSPNYQWLVNGNPDGSNSDVFATSSLEDGDEVTCVLVSDEVCATLASIESQPIAVTVIPSVTPDITVTAFPAGAICVGTQVTFTAIPSGQGVAPSYAWTVNGNAVGTDSDTYISNTLVDGDMVKCTLTASNDDGCTDPLTVDSDHITMTVSSELVPSVSVTSDAGAAICPGQTVVFTAVPLNSGGSPSYEWTSNGSVVGTDSDTYTTNTLADGDVIVCTLASSATCANPTEATSPDFEVVITTAPVLSGQTITGDTDVCATEAVTYTVGVVNGATHYDWTLPSGWAGTSMTNTISATASTTDGTISVTAGNACGSTSPVTLGVNANPNFSTLSGTVTTSAGAPIFTGWVFTYIAVIDTINDDAYYYEKADSTTIVGGNYSFPNLSLYEVPFILKAVALGTQSDLIPTYHATFGGQLNCSHEWNNDTLTYELLSTCGGILSKNIKMIAVGTTDGLCSLNGSVMYDEVQGVGKFEQTVADEPVPLIDVVVERVPPGNAFTATVTDNEGRYRFEDMPVLEGDAYYRIYIAIPGIPMVGDNYEIIITPSDTAINELDFLVDTITNEIFILDPNGVRESLTLVDELRIFPNPMHDQMTVILPAKFGEVKGYRMLSIDGKLVEEHALIGNEHLTVQRGSLPSGIYFLEVYNTQGLRRAAKVVVQ